VSLTTGTVEMRLGFYTYSYTDRLRMPVVDCLERIARIGYSGIDVSGTDGPSIDPKSVSPDLRRLTRKTAERLKLRIEAVITHYSLAVSLSEKSKGPLDLRGTVDTAVDLGAPVVTFHMGGYPEKVPREVFWRKVVVAIRQAADYAAARHVAVAVDGIWPVWVDDSPDTLDRLFRDVGAPNFGVNFDPSYLALMGVEPTDFVKRFAGRIVHAHLKDYERTGKYPKWTEVMPGRGALNYSAIFGALKWVKFNGSCSVECFTFMKFEEACDEGYRAMTAAAQKAGVRFTPAG
jgi:sugar phosphate isomerase/epimerase